MRQHAQVTKRELEQRREQQERKAKQSYDRARRDEEFDEQRHEQLAIADEKEAEMSLQLLRNLE